MRKLLRAMAKAEMERRGYSKVNRRMMYWRDHRRLPRLPGQ